LSRADLQLPLQQSVTAGAHVRRRGEQETLWRLAFDELQRDWRGVDEYLPLPNLKKSLLNGGFTAFARWALETKAMPELAARCQLEARGFKVKKQNTGSPVLEWCAGKGHLGRLLSSVQGREVKSLEWQAKLCAQGEQQALHWRLPQRFVCADAFAAESAEQLLAGEQVVALHACGDLHTDLMQRWSKALETTPESMLANSEPSRLTLSPCCYHLIRAEQYQPMSAAGQASALRLSRADLQLPLQQSVTAGAHVRRRGEQETLWRLAFDELQRDLRGVDEYLPLPNLKKSLLNGGFAAFARWAFETKAMPELAARCEAEVHGFKVEEQNTQSTDSERLKAKHFNAEHYLTRGAERLQHTRRMELVTHAFRRPLEVWLALDRALFLSERGARVSLSTFCEAALTPRNILLHAQHSPSGAR